MRVRNELVERHAGRALDDAAEDVGVVAVDVRLRRAARRTAACRAAPSSRRSARPCRRCTSRCPPRAPGPSPRTSAATCGCVPYEMPAVCVSRSRIVIWRLAGTVSTPPPSFATGTVVFANAGMKRLTGSVSAELALPPCSTRTAALVIALVCDAMRKIVSGASCAGRLPCRSSRRRARRRAARRAARARRRRRCGSRPRTAAAQRSMRASRSVENDDVTGGGNSLRRSTTGVRRRVRSLREDSC